MAMNLDVNNLSCGEEKINNDKTVETSNFVLSDHILTTDKLLEKFVQSKMQLENLKKEHAEIVLKLEDKSEAVENLTTSMETMQKTNDFLQQRVQNLQAGNLNQRDGHELKDLHEKLENKTMQLELLRIENQGLKKKNSELMQQQQQNSGRPQEDYEYLAYLLQIKETTLQSLQCENRKLHQNLLSIQERLASIDLVHDPYSCSRCKSQNLFGTMKCSFNRNVGTLLDDIQKLISPPKTN